MGLTDMVFFLKGGAGCVQPGVGGGLCKYSVSYKLTCLRSQIQCRNCEQNLLLQDGKAIYSTNASQKHKNSEVKL